MSRQNLDSEGVSYGGLVSLDLIQGILGGWRFFLNLSKKNYFFLLTKVVSFFMKSCNYINLLQPTAAYGSVVTLVQRTIVLMEKGGRF